VDEAFRAKLRSKLADYRAWSSGRAFADCHLVHYSGVDLIAAQTVPLTEVERRIEGLVCESFYIDWADHGGRLCLRVWEYGGPEPEWPRVFAEEPLADIAELLRRIGQDAE
jgi:hypothetical protein